MRESFCEFISARYYFLNFHSVNILGARFQPYVDMRPFISLFLRGRKQTDLWTQMGRMRPTCVLLEACTQKRSRSCFYFDIIMWPRSCHPELWRTITEVSTGNVFLWAFPGDDAGVEAAGRKFWMHGLAPNSTPSCFPLNANRQESFGSLAHIQVPKYALLWFQRRFKKTKTNQTKTP